MILIWISHLSSLGRVGETAGKVEDQAYAALKRHNKYPWLQAQPLQSLQQIPKELYEAAEVDGASRWKQFRNVTWPMSMPTTLVVMAYTTIQSFRAFDLIMVMTNSTVGPNNSTNIFSTLIYLTLFNELRLGYAAAQTIFMVIVMILITWLQRQTFGKRYEK